MSNFFETLSKVLGKVTGILVVCMMSIAIISLNIQVFTRYILGDSASWSEELAMFLFTWSILLVGSLGVREKFHVSLTFFLDLLSEKIRGVTVRILHFITLVVGIVFAFSGVNYVERTLGQVSAAVQYPVEWLHVSAPVAGILISVHALAHLFSRQENEEMAQKEECLI